MGNRKRVLSFMSGFSASNRDGHLTTENPPPPRPRYESPSRRQISRDATSPSRFSQLNSVGSDASQPREQRERAQSGSRPISMVQTYQPPLMDVNQDTLPELQPIFTFLNSHANKLYQEGYFLKLDDQNTHGRPNASRTWTECFAQLVGTVLSLWDAAELDSAGQEGEVLPKFINLTDASIKMIESLPTRSDNEAPLQNVLSISTAGKNRYLLHFNSHHSLIQWTAGIRLSMYEHATLQEAYTGALIAGKGKALNNINVIMERSKTATADWARVRFGAGTPWRRCWCVISPPDEKEVLKLQKQLKKKSAYDRSRPPILKGNIKFYDSKKTKKAQPIATITDAYSAFAIYPQSKPLIDASTLVKVEGSITIHSSPPSTTEGFVFVMPEVHPAVTGFEMMLRWLFPVFDTFGLYGRPGRLVAATEDIRSLMFAMPKHRRYGYLEILDVTGLILEKGSSNWRESEWRKRMKELTAKRMTAIENGSGSNSRYDSRRNIRSSTGHSHTRGVQFDDNESIKSTLSKSWRPGTTGDGAHAGLRARTDSAPPTASALVHNRAPPYAHHRSLSETLATDRSKNDGVYENTSSTPLPSAVASGMRYTNELGRTPERSDSGMEQPGTDFTARELQELQDNTHPEPVAVPPAFAHPPGSKPISKPFHSPELRRANSRMSQTTLAQITGTSSAVELSTNEELNDSEDQRLGDSSRPTEHVDDRELGPAAILNESTPNRSDLDEAMAMALPNRFSFENRASSLPRISMPTVYTSTFDHSVPAAPAPTKELPPLPKPSAESKNPMPVAATGHHSHPSISSTTSTTSQPPSPPKGSTVSQKMFPGASNPSSLKSVETASSRGSLERYVIDLDALDTNDTERLESFTRDQMKHSVTGSSSIYDDDTSTGSPDYASTRKSVESRRSVEKPRAGVKRIVGELNFKDNEKQVATTPPIQIDFGPTINYAMAQSHGASKSYSRANSPGPALNQYVATVRQGSPSRKGEGDGQSKSPSKKVPPSDNPNYRNNIRDSRSSAWNPILTGAGNPLAHPKGITAEPFVAPRASIIPMYAHQRQLSGDALLSRIPTPPLARMRSSDRLAQATHSRSNSRDRLAQISHSHSSSTDLLQRPASRAVSVALGYSGHSRSNSTDRLAQISHSRNNSTDLLQRPGSRGASAALGPDLMSRPGSRGVSLALGPSGTGDMTAHLSARELEHLAKVTGQPLISMASSGKHVPAAGLVGALEARDRDKEALKHGLSSQAVEHAIQHRQQQTLYQQHSSHGPSDLRTTSQYGIVGQYPVQYAVPDQRQQPFPNSAVGMFAPSSGGGWASATPTYAVSLEQARQTIYSQSPISSQGTQPGSRGNVGWNLGHGSPWNGP